MYCKVYCKENILNCVCVCVCCVFTWTGPSGHLDRGELGTQPAKLHIPDIPNYES